MSNSATNETNGEGGLYPIRTVSDLTGVNAITLRAWERRHALFEPIRQPSGHRLYSQGHIDLIIKIVGLLDQGMRIGQVKAHLEAETTPRKNQQTDNIWKRYLDQMTACITRFDEAGLEAVCTKALSLYPEATVTENLMVPLLKELECGWQNNKGCIIEERFFSFYIRNKFGARFHHRLQSQNGPKILLSCVPGDRYETGLLLFALAASAAGYKTILLGADMPLHELPATAKKTGCKAIILSGRLRPEPKILNRALPALTLETDIPVFLGGQASVELHDVLKRANVHALGTNLNTSLARLGEFVSLQQ